MPLDATITIASPGRIFDPTASLCLGRTSPVPDPERTTAPGSTIPERAGVSPPAQTAPDSRQAAANRSHVQKLEAETKAYLKAGDRETASKFALELQKAKEELAANEQQLQMHETAYGNSLKKIQHANGKLIELREKITKYDADLKMSSAEAEIAKLSETFDINLTTNFGEIESVIQQKIDQNRGKVRVAADLSEKGIADIKAEERMQGQLAEQALQNFEVELGIRSPETTPVAQSAKDLGPATERATEKQTN